MWESKKKNDISRYSTILEHTGCIQVYTNLKAKYSKVLNLNQLISIKKAVEEELVISGIESYI